MAQTGVCLTSTRWEGKVVSEVPNEIALRVEQVLLGSEWFWGRKTALGTRSRFVQDAAQRPGRFLETESSELILPPGLDTRYLLDSPPGSFKCTFLMWKLTFYCGIPLAPPLAAAARCEFVTLTGCFGRLSSSCVYFLCYRHSELCQGFITGTGSDYTASE